MTGCRISQRRSRQLVTSQGMNYPARGTTNRSPRLTGAARRCPVKARKPQGTRSESRSTVPISNLRSYFFGIPHELVGVRGRAGVGVGA